MIGELTQKGTEPPGTDMRITWHDKKKKEKHKKNISVGFVTNRNNQVHREIIRKKEGRKGGRKGGRKRGKLIDWLTLLWSTTIPKGNDTKKCSIKMRLLTPLSIARRRPSSRTQ